MKNRDLNCIIGPPQRHGQNLYKQNIATYSQELSGDIDGYDETFSEGEKFETELVDSSIRIGYQLTHHIKVNNTGICMGTRTTDRYSSNLLNERENFFHKPLVNLNHFYEINEQMRLSSVLYWSGGSVVEQELTEV